MPALALELWHLLLAGAAAVSVLLVPTLKVRQLLREHRADSRRREDRAVERARQQDDFLRRLESVENWRAEHSATCTAEHREIQTQIQSSTDRLAERLADMTKTAAEERQTIHSRLNAVERMQGEIKGGLDVLLSLYVAPRQRAQHRTGDAP